MTIRQKLLLAVSSFLPVAALAVFLAAAPSASAFTKQCSCPAPGGAWGCGMCIQSACQQGNSSCYMGTWVCGC